MNTSSTEPTYVTLLSSVNTMNVLELTYMYDATDASLKPIATPSKEQKT